MFNKGAGAELHIGGRIHLFELLLIDIFPLEVLWITRHARQIGVLDDRMLSALVYG